MERSEIHHTVRALDFEASTPASIRPSNALSLFEKHPRPTKSDFVGGINRAINRDQPFF